MQKQIIYLDHAATTYVKPEVFEAMKPYFTEEYGNPSSIYSIGRLNRKVVEDARISVAKSIGAAEPSEIHFTGSGTEGDNWAIKGTALKLMKKGKHIITSNIEHPAVLATCEFLEKQGYEITYIKVDDKGLINPEDVNRAIRPDTILVSVMMANNEIGTIEPIKEIAQVCKKHGVLFHTDAVQAAGNILIDVKDLGVDLLSVSGHKFYGPKGIGMLYIRKGVKIENFVHGGHQERNKRAGTENARFHVLDWDTAELKQLGWQKRFQLVFASRTPAVYDRATLEKMTDASRGYCCLITQVTGDNSVRRELAPVVGAENHDDYTRRGLYSAFNILWLQGYYPEVEYLERSWDSECPLEEAIVMYTRHFNSRGQLTEEQEIALADKLCAISKNGMVHETGSSRVGVLFWNANL